MRSTPAEHLPLVSLTVQDLGCPHNLVHLMRHHGLSEQETYDRIQEMIRDRYKQWYLALAKLPVYGEKIDQQVHRYIRGVENIILANATWRYAGLPSPNCFVDAAGLTRLANSFRTQRYYGKHSQQVRETRRVEFAPSKADWIPPIVTKPRVRAQGKPKA